MNVHYDFPHYELSAVEGILSRIDTPSEVHFTGGSFSGQADMFTRGDSESMVASSIREFWFLVNTYGTPHGAVT